MTAVRESKGLVAGSKGLSLDKLPLLGDLFEQIATETAERIRDRCTTSALVKPRGMASDREDAVLKTFEKHNLAFILFDPAWECRLAIVLDQDFVFTLIEAMLGSDGGDAAFKEPRPFSTIERSVSRAFVELVVEALNDGLSAMSPAEFAIEKVETRLEFVVLGSRSEDAVLARVGLEALGRSGDLSIVLPQMAIEKIRAHLVIAPGKEAKRKDDPQWARQFGQRVTGAEVLIHASIEAEGFVLGDVARMVPGQVLTLGDQVQKKVLLACEGEELYRCELGQSDGFYSIRVLSVHENGAGAARAELELVDS